MEHTPDQSHWSFTLARLARKYPQLTDDDLRWAGHESELLARLQQRTGAAGEALAKIIRVDVEEDGPPPGAGDGLNDDAGLRGSGIPENTSQSGLSGI